MQKLMKQSHDTALPKLPKVGGVLYCTLNFGDVFDAEGKYNNFLSAHQEGMPVNYEAYTSTSTKPEVIRLKRARNTVLRLKSRGRQETLRALAITLKARRCMSAIPSLLLPKLQRTATATHLFLHRRSMQMDWDKIMEMKDPHKALLAIAEKIEADDLGLVEMENRVEQYADLHGITPDEMAFYPNGERVIQP